MVPRIMRAGPKADNILSVIRVLNGELHYDYIKTGYQEDGLATIHGMKEERFVKQRKRLLENVKVLAHLVGCSFFVDGDSATSVGFTGARNGV